MKHHTAVEMLAIFGAIFLGIALAAFGPTELYAARESAADYQRAGTTEVTCVSSNTYTAVPGTTDTLSGRFGLYVDAISSATARFYWKLVDNSTGPATQGDDGFIYAPSDDPLLLKIGPNNQLFMKVFGGTIACQNVVSQDLK